MNSILPTGFSILTFVIFFLLTFALIFLILVLFYVFVSAVFEKISRKKIEQEAKEVHDGAYEEALRILDEARLKSIKVLSDSQLKAQKLLSDTRYVSDEKKKELSKRVEDLYVKEEVSFKQLSNDLIKSYKEALEKEQTENIRTLAETTEMIKDEVLSDIGEFKETILKETVDSQRQIDEKLRKSYEEAEKEIESYREEKIAALNEKIFLILADITEQVIGKAVDQTDHEKMILDSLKDEVKKLGINHDSQTDN